MSHIIQNFGYWKKVNEDDVPGRERESGGDNNKVVAIPVDKETLKLKIVNDADIIDGNGKLTIDGFKTLLDWIKSQGEIISYYTALNDLTNNVVIYSISKDNDRKQVVIFKIYSKVALKTQDPSAAGINSQVQYIRQDELTQALQGTILNTNALKQIKNQQTSATLVLPFPAASIIGSTDAKAIAFIITAYNKIKKDPVIAASPIMPAVKAEVVANSLGKNTSLFIKGLNAGFGILDAKFKEDIESDITKTLYDKITFIPEAESAVIAGFNIDAFNKVIASAAPETGDIKVPTGGFKNGMQDNPELAKVQNLLLKKFKKVLSNHSAYQNFANAGKKGFTGNYGELTAALVNVIKIGLEDPYWTGSRDGNTIEPEFISRILAEKLPESTTYLGLDGITIITEGFAAPPESQTAKKKSTSSTSTTKKSTTKKVTDIYELPDTRLQTKPGEEFQLINYLWYLKLNGVWTIVSNPKIVTKLIFNTKRGQFPLMIASKSSSTGWIIPSYALRKVSGDTYSTAAIGYTYSYDTSKNQWETYLNGKWEQLDDPTLLITAYGTNPFKSMTNVATSGVSTATIDKEVIALGNSIKTFVEDDATFNDYKGDFDDSEEDAWNDVLYPKWTTEWKGKLATLRSKVKASTLINATDKTRYEKGFKNIEIMFTAGIDSVWVDGSTFFGTFNKGAVLNGDTWGLMLYLAGAGVKKINIDCDF